jgi:hypothetical protein
VKATIGVDFSPYPADRKGCRRLQSTYGAVHGIDDMLVADKDGNAEIDRSACGGVGAGNASERGGQDEGNEVGKDDKGENQSVKGEEVPKTPGGLGAQLWREVLGASKPLELALVSDDRLLDLLTELLLLFRDGRRDERRLKEREQLLLLVQTEVGEVLGLEAQGASNAFLFMRGTNGAVVRSRLRVGAWADDIDLNGHGSGRGS